MSSNFFIDFAAFNFLGYMAGFDWMVVFSAATFLALLTRQFQSRLTHRAVLTRVSRKKGNFRGLPAFRRDRDDR